jgi:serpin B
MPYGNKAFSMTIILPSENKTTADVLTNLTLENWKNTLNKLVVQQVMLSMPRFKVENKFTLNEVLKNMGMNLAFTDKADFSNISSINLMISKVLHKTYITVDEEGTEAAAVTSIEFTTTSMPNYPIFTVNKPFVFVIREKSTGVILFIGKIGNVEKY